MGWESLEQERVAHKADGLDDGSVSACRPVLPPRLLHMASMFSRERCCATPGVDDEVPKDAASFIITGGGWTGGC